jgi:hypothetical protein
MSLHQHEFNRSTVASLSTSANGAMHAPAPILLVGPVLVTESPAIGGALREALRSGTSGAGLFEEIWEDIFGPPPQTSSGFSVSDAPAEESESTARAINELHRLSGLTWEQLADLFQLARRSLHFWASGKPLNAGNEERLRRVLAAIRTADRGSASSNRAMLLQDRDGAVPFDLLVREEYDLFIELVGTGPGRREVKLAPLSPEARAARRPPPPDELVGALQDRVHVEKGKLISSTPIRRRREK